MAYLFITEQDDGDKISDMDWPEYLQINMLRVNGEGVKTLLEKLNVNKASGSDDLPAYILKELAEEISPILTIKYIQSLQDSSLSQYWLKANVTPFFLGIRRPTNTW